MSVPRRSTIASIDSLRHWNWRNATRDPHEVDDEFWAELQQFYDEGEIIDLLAAIGLFNYLNRFNADALRMEPTK